MALPGIFLSSLSAKVFVAFDIIYDRKLETVSR